MTFDAIKAGLSNLWDQIVSTGSAVVAKGSELVATYGPIAKTQAVALATLAHSSVTVPVVAQATALVAPLGVAGPAVWLVPAAGAGLISMALNSKGDEVESSVARVALRITGFVFAVAAGAAAAVFMGSILGLGTTLGIAATYGTGAVVALGFSLMPCVGKEPEV